MLLRDENWSLRVVERESCVEEICCLSGFWLRKELARVLLQVDILFG